MMQTLRDLLQIFPHSGTLQWIGTRPARKATMVSPQHAQITQTGLDGDRHSIDNKRAVTLIQAEHLPVIAALARTDIAPQMLRRNLVISGINLAALRGHRLKIGSAILEITGPCAPCSRMETTITTGGYNAMRGHGGMTARVITPGNIALNDTVSHVKTPQT